MSNATLGSANAHLWKLSRTKGWHSKEQVEVLQQSFFGKHKGYAIDESRLKKLEEKNCVEIILVDSVTRRVFWVKFESFKALSMLIDYGTTQYALGLEYWTRVFPPGATSEYADGMNSAPSEEEDEEEEDEDDEYDCVGFREFTSKHTWEFEDQVTSLAVSVTIEGTKDHARDVFTRIRKALDLP
ncbi:MAG: hypothetical protein V3T23_06790 [Nitrososphaerales archaeon]